jgi:hypothetical protein
MILAADSEYIPSPLQLMLVTWEIGFPIPPVSRFFFGKRELPDSRFAGIGTRKFTGGKQGIPDSRFGRERESGSRGRRAGDFLVSGWPDRSARHGCLEKGGFARRFLDTPCSISKKMLQVSKKTPVDNLKRAASGAWALGFKFNLILLAIRLLVG